MAVLLRSQKPSAILIDMSFDVTPLGFVEHSSKSEA